MRATGGAGGPDARRRVNGKQKKSLKGLPSLFSVQSNVLLIRSRRVFACLLTSGLDIVGLGFPCTQKLFIEDVNFCYGGSKSH